MKTLSSRDWFGKTAAAVILGFFIALGCAGLFRWTMGLTEAFFSVEGQFSMWMMAPIWALIISFCFFFSSTARAWLWLALANVALWSALWLGGVLQP